jgi:aminopeptidase N
MRRLATSLLLACHCSLACGLATARADTYPKNPKIDVVDYRFALELSDADDRVAGTADIEVRVGGGESRLRFDLANLVAATGKGMTVSSVTVDGAPAAFVHRDDAIVIELPPRAAGVDGPRRVRIVYAGIPASGLRIGPNRHGERTFFSDNWPDKARQWLPTVDHIGDKATSTMDVIAPAHYQVVSNGLLQEETDLPGGRRRTIWRQSVPIAPWLFVLGAARFAVQHLDPFDGKPVQTWVYATDRDAGFHDFAVPTRDVLAFFSERIGPFAYEKLANVQSSSVSGGMEAASAIFYSEGSVTGQRTERWRNVIIHEIAHQWFGNAVTEADWDDVWLSEGFATYFTLLYIEHAYGRDEFLRGLESSRQRILAFDTEQPDYRVVHDNLADMTKVTTGQTYQKGAWVLHMLRGMIGDDAFWAGIRDYYRAHLNGQATTADFRGAMERASGRDLRGFFDQWLSRGGLVRVRGDWRYRADDKKVVVTLAQRDAARLFAMPLPIGLYGEAGNTAPALTTIQLTGASQTFEIPADRKPDRVVLDPDHVVLLDAEFAEAR